MKILLVICLLGLIAFSSAAPAKKWLCKDLGNGNSTGWDKVCAKLEGEEWGVEVCDKGFFCPAHLGDTAEYKCKKPDDQEDTRYPGDTCANDEQCFHQSNCTDGVCNGRPSGETCYQRGECDVDLYCNNENSKCEADLKTGASCVSGQFDGCEFHNDCFEGKCVRYYSLDYGTVVSMSERKLCKSNFVFMNNVTSKYECSHNPQYLGGDDYSRDEPSQSCEFEIPPNNASGSPTKIKRDAYPGFNQDGKYYCDKGGRESKLQGWLEKIRTHYSIDWKCHLMSAGRHCKVITDDKKGYVYYLETVFNKEAETSSWANYANNADCVKQTVTNEYWDNLKKADTASALAVGAILAAVSTYLF